MFAGLFFTEAAILSQDCGLGALLGWGLRYVLPVG